MKFEFASAGRIVFGPGCLNEALGAVRDIGRRALVVTGRDATRADPVLRRLRELGITATTLSITGEPSVETAVSGVEQGREFGAELVLGFGGGSALDAAKAVAALLANPGDPLEYLEVVGAGKPLRAPALPCVAIPTTAGTGSEVTKNAVLASTGHRVKVSLRHASMLPRLAIVDSDLTLSVPPHVTAATGLDALTQCIEPYLSHWASPMTDALALEGISWGAQSLERAYRNGSDSEARRGMALTSLFGGLALANAKLGAVHGLAGPAGGMSDAPHGAICARLLPLVLDANLTALRQRAPNHPALARMETVARALTGETAPEAAIEWTKRLVVALDIQGLAHYGLTEAQLPELVDKARRASSMQGNPIELTEAELTDIAHRALGRPELS